MELLDCCEPPDRLDALLIPVVIVDITIKLACIPVLCGSGGGVSLPDPQILSGLWPTRSSGHNDQSLLLKGAEELNE